MHLRAATLQFIALILITLVTSVTFGGARISNFDLAQRVAAKTLTQLQASGRVYSWDVATPRDRTPHYCSEECSCLNSVIAPELRARGFEVRTFVLHPTKGAGQIEMRGAPSFIYGPATYSYHVITTINVDGQW